MSVKIRMKKYLIEGQAPADPNAAQTAASATQDATQSNTQNATQGAAPQTAATNATNQTTATPTATAGNANANNGVANATTNNGDAANTDANSNNEQAQKENEEIANLNANVLTFYQGLFQSIQQQCSNENLGKIIPFLKTAYDNGESQYNASAKSLSDKARDLSNFKVNELANVPDALTKFKDMLDGLNGFLKAVAEAQANAAKQQQATQQ